MAALTPPIKRKFEAYALGKPTWQPDNTEDTPGVCWRDHLVYDIGPDPQGDRFSEIARRMLSGNYYPSDTIESFGLWMEQGREIQRGDRILQRIRLAPWIPWPVLWGMTEVFVAERSERACCLGYVTTDHHFGVGVWRADLRAEDQRLTLEVSAISGPHSWLFWIGLPFGRWLQRKAWSKAAAAFQAV